VARHALVGAAITLCERALVWQEKQSPVVLEAADFPYVVPTPDHGRLARINAVVVDGVRIAPTTVDHLDSTGAWEDVRGPMAAYFTTPDMVLRVYPTPVAPASVQVTAAYAPQRDATVLEAFLHDVWYDTLVAGALWKLLGMPQQPWTNGDVAEHYRVTFEQALRRASVTFRHDDATRARLIVQQQVI
jgi:hypothetical protein